MLPVRLLALTVCSYITPALRKPLRPQPHRSYHHSWRPLPLSTDGEEQRITSPAIRNVHLGTMASSTSTASSPAGEGVAAEKNSPSGDCSGSDSDRSDALRLDTAAGVYRYLRGRWDLEKTIDYKAGGMAGTWQGVASFSPQEGCENSKDTPAPQEESANSDGSHSSRDSAALLLLRYLEQGTFRVNGKGDGFEAGQRLVYDCSGQVVRVHFVDDPKKPESLRFFHELDFRSSREPSADETATAHAGEGAEVCGKVATSRDKISVSPRAEFEHLCVRDMYRGQVEVVGPNEFRTR